ncbi:Ig-like domain-containing protein [Bacillus safensis]|uniref:Ig-like domain-containing protein n=1 Tax=Bacillus TaxID=1386 RepID=UPI0005971861|nr:Ig-like domain-containing protein [Bacillus safensis]MBQ4840336.1 Ig-like domain-containing protein [Bacillus safensis]MBQ4872164.1 Ig-like domain-containing protein [Bacillus safensis]MBQ4885790.1 Ig-like domain-containing protein [Bacillus safensis]MDV3449336.1 Ig-like domain-containing protein [Bacillus safensis]USD77949.1 Ig-like domain-containing protein [Bacillus safensis]
MNMKKTIVSVLSISTLSFSLMGMASAKETADFTVNYSSSGFQTLDVISIQDYSVSLRVGEQYSVYNSAATRYWTDKQSVASVSSNGIVTAHSPGKATITLYKGTSVLGQVFVTVY